MACFFPPFSISCDVQFCVDVDVHTNVQNGIVASSLNLLL